MKKQLSNFYKPGLTVLTPVGQGTVLGKLYRYNYDTGIYDKPSSYIRVVMDEGINIPNDKGRLLLYHSQGGVGKGHEKKVAEKVVSKILSGRAWCKRSVLEFREEALSGNLPFYGDCELEFHPAKGRNHPALYNKKFLGRLVGYAVSGEHLVILDAEPQDYMNSDRETLYDFEEAYHFIPEDNREFKAMHKSLNFFSVVYNSSWVTFDNHIFSFADWKGVLKRVEEYVDNRPFRSEIKFLWSCNLLSFNCLRPAPRVTDWLE